jgi:hypothetical protein
MSPAAAQQQPVTLTPEGAAVQPLPFRMDAQTIERQCQLITAFTVEEGGDNAARIERALVKARNQAGAAGGNALRLDSTRGNADSHTFFVRALHCTGLPTTVTGRPAAAQQPSSTLRITDLCTQRSDYTIDDKVVTPSQRDSLAAHLEVAFSVAPGPRAVRMMRYDSTGALVRVARVTMVVSPGTSASLHMQGCL